MCFYQPAIATTSTTAGLQFTHIGTGQALATFHAEQGDADAAQSYIKRMQKRAE